MKVLVVHNRYSSASPSGENSVVDAEVEALRSAGVDVETYFRSSDEFQSASMFRRLQMGASPITGWASRSDLDGVLEAYKPDVMHLHNPYPLVSPMAISQCVAKRVPVVATVHNYRRACLNGALTRDGHYCDVCVGRSSIKGVIHGCYRGSVAQSAVIASAQLLHGRRWNGVSKYLAVSEYIRRWLMDDGVPSNAITVKPNMVADQRPATSDGRGVLYAGRLVAEKGVEDLVRAWERLRPGLDYPLTIAGSGPLRDALESRYGQVEGLRFVGNLTRAQLEVARASAALCVVPSAWPEPFGLTVVESFAASRPVVATAVGGLSELVDDNVGWLVAPGADSLAEALDVALRSRSIADKGAAARLRYESTFCPDVVVQQLIAAYESVLT